MSRTPLIVGLTVALTLPALARAIDPHLDPNLVPSGCPACHKGHGLSQSPMLPAAQSEVCLTCHGSEARAEIQVREGNLASDADPPLMSFVLSSAFTHPLTAEALSRHEPGVVTCTSCHSPHRSRGEVRPAASEASAASEPTGRKRLSSRDRSRFENETCLECHGSAGVSTQSFLDISRLVNPNSASYHPLEAPSPAAAPSTVTEVAQNEVNCTDCHGNSDPNGPAGPHGSEIPYVLRAEYATVDGKEESEEVYTLCYRCHDRQAVLESSRFPEHGRHIIQSRVSCATCHNPHGSIDNRALIRFGEETVISSVGPSPATGRLAFESDSPGSGSCFLSCHGVDHAPLTYGGASPAADSLELVLDSYASPSFPGGPPPPPKPRPRKQRPPR